MMSNFSFWLEQMPEEKFFGQFGMEHVYQSACDTAYWSEEYNRFAMRLNEENSPVRGKVCSIGYLYVDQNDTGSYNDRDYMRMNWFEDWYGQDVMIALDDKGSPFDEGEYLFFEKAEGKATIDYLQKLLILSGSRQTIPY